MTSKDRRLVFVDVEAIGSIRSPHVIQIAAIATDGSTKELAGFEAKAKLPPNCRTRPKHSRYNQKQWEQEGHEAIRVARDFAAFLTRNATVERYNKNDQLFRVAQLVAHNSAFDTEVLKNWFSRLDVYLPASFQSLCTLQRAMWHSQEVFASNNCPKDFQLTTLCQHFGIEHSPGQAHDAFVDVRATLLLYRSLV